MESQEILEKIKETFPCPEQDVRAYSPLTLAFIGDGVYSLVVRTMVVCRANRANNALYHDAVKYEKAEKNASLGDYHKATGLEALYGYLYLSGRTDRMLELMKAGIEGLENK